MLKAKLNVEGSIKILSFDHESTYYSLLKDEGLHNKSIAVLIKNDELGERIFDIASKIYRKDIDFDKAIIEPILATSNSKESLKILRHSCAHLLAQAVTNLYPDSQFSIGPVIANGFFYDFKFKNNEKISTDDFEKIIDEMKFISGKKIPVRRFVVSKKVAERIFEITNQEYKIHLLNRIPSSEDVSLYTHGLGYDVNASSDNLTDIVLKMSQEREFFIDLCKGPHVPNTRFLKHFWLTGVSSAHWLDEKYPSMQRIYGTIWESQQSCESYIQLLEKIKNIDHRKTGKLMELFHQQRDAPGDIFWHPKGWSIFLKITEYIRSVNKLYSEVNTPSIMKRELWEKSGHWEKFKENMFDLEIESTEYAVKPMNCPGHIQIFNSSPKSYKDLPIRFSEFGCCKRFEPSGSIHGLMRLRAFTQDDGHIFCTENQIESESRIFLKEVFRVYSDFGFNSISIKLSTRPKIRGGSDEMWDKAEDALKNVLDKENLKYELQEGEGAFYGPKTEFSLIDASNREWQCGTLQVDFLLPQRMSAVFVNKSGDKECVIMLHRAILGSIERFLAILLEHYEGRLPLWISPVHCVLVGISNEFDQNILQISKELSESGVISISDTSSDTMQSKIRKHSVSKVPIICIIGKSEIQKNTISIRCLGSKEKYEIKIDGFAKTIKKCIDLKLDLGKCIQELKNVSDISKSKA